MPTLHLRQKSAHRKSSRGPHSSVNEQLCRDFRAQTNRWRHRVAMCELVGETGSVACAASTLRNLTAAPTTRPSVIALYHIEKARVTLAHFYHGPSLTSQMARPFACRVAAPRWRRPCAAPDSPTIRDGCRAATATSFLTASSSTTWTSSRGLTHTCRARRSAERRRPDVSGAQHSVAWPARLRLGL